MKRYIWVVYPSIILFVTACTSFMPTSSPVDDSDLSKITASPNVDLDATPTNLVLSETPTETSQPDITITPEASTLPATPVVTDDYEEPTLTPIIEPTNIMEPAPTPTQTVLGLQVGSPVGLPNFAHPDLACQWMGLAGQVFDPDDLPMDDLVVEVGGTLDGKPLFGLSVTGESSAYGPGGYEIKLGDEPIESNGSVWVQVFSLDGIALTSQIYFPTYRDCDKNVILMNFVQSYKLPTPWVYLPIISNKSSNP